jgi:hypothetical protein
LRLGPTWCVSWTRALAFAHTLELDGVLVDSRFTAFRDRLAKLADILERDGNAAAFKRFTDDLELNAVTLTESQELVTILPYLQALPPERVKKKLKIALGGPELPADEDDSSNHARNTMFELNLAARLHRAGIKVEIGGAPDLEFMCNGVRWFGECKRPYHIETVEKNLAKACEQLGVRLASSRLAARGLLAISISRPLTTRAPYLEYVDETNLKQSLKEHVGAIVGLMESQMRELKQCQGVSGTGLLLAHLIMPAWNPAARMPTGIQYSAGTDVCRDGRGDGERLWRIIQRTFGG